MIDCGTFFVYSVTHGKWHVQQGLRKATAIHCPEILPGMSCSENAQIQEVSGTLSRGKNACEVSVVHAHTNQERTNSKAPVQKVWSKGASSSSLLSKSESYNLAVPPVPLGGAS